jgi:hypothetical protein
MKQLQNFGRFSEKGTNKMQVGRRREKLKVIAKYGSVENFVMRSLMICTSHPILCG